MNEVLRTWDIVTDTSSVLGTADVVTCMEPVLGYNSNSQNSPVVERAHFWAFDENSGLFYLGSNASGSDDLRIALLSGRRAKIEMRNAIQNINRGRASDADREKVATGFMNINIQSEEEQTAIINELRALQRDTGNEHGRFMELGFRDGEAVVRFGTSLIVGTRNTIPFSVQAGGSAGNIRTTRGAFIIGTIHTHYHNDGLSGFRTNPREAGFGGGDNALTRNFGVPTFTLGPREIHVGIPNVTQGREPTMHGVPAGTTNLLRYALMWKRRVI